MPSPPGRCAGSFGTREEVQMAAKYETTVALKGNAVEPLLDAVASWAASERWRVQSRTDCAIVCLVPLNLWSWGELVRVVVEHDSLRVISQCTFPLQVFDWGKNARNVERVRDNLVRAMRASA